MTTMKHFYTCAVPIPVHLNYTKRYIGKNRECRRDPKPVPTRSIVNSTLECFVLFGKCMIDNRIRDTRRENFYYNVFKCHRIPNAGCSHCISLNGLDKQKNTKSKQIFAVSHKRWYIYFVSYWQKKRRPRKRAVVNRFIIIYPIFEI